VILKVKKMKILSEKTSPAMVLSFRPRSICSAFLLLLLLGSVSVHAGGGFMLRVTAENAAIKSEGSELARVPKGTRLWCFSVKEENLAEVKVPEKNDHGWLELSQVEEIQPSMVEKSKLQKAEEHHKRSLELSKQERHDEAKREIEAALAITREVRGSDHPKVADLLIALGSLESELADQSNARDCYQEAFDIKRATLGANHVGTWNVLYQLGMMMDDSELRDRLYAETNAPRITYLLDLGKRKLIPVNRDANGNLELLPNRIYYRLEPKTKKWVFDKTGDQASFSNPARYLLPLSDIPGEWVGANAHTAWIFLGPPHKGWDAWKEIKREDASGRYMFWNFTGPGNQGEESVHYHSVNREDF
jgi:tetratricopeptide (TPR) repeat protein